MEWQFNEGSPIYVQLTQEIEMQIARGVYKAGDRMPAVRELAMEAGVNPNTVQRAMADLEREGLIYTERTSGRFVTKDEERIKQLRKKLAQMTIAEFYEKMKQLGMSHEEMVQALETFLKEE